MLEEARRRLLWACVAFLLGFGLAYLVPRIVFGGVWLAAHELPGLVAAVGSMVVAAVLAVLARGARVATSRLLGLGLVFEVVGSYAISVAEWWWFYSPAHLAMMPSPMIHGISWVFVWMVVFPALVPATRWRAIAATALSAPAPALVLAASHAYFSPAMEPGRHADTIVGGLIAGAVAGALAGVTSAAIRSLGRKVRQARELGSYTLVERLGTGGMGEVWRAQHRLLARPAALKLVLPDVQARQADGTSPVLRRFEVEAQVISSLRCPNTIQLYDFGVTADGRLYYAMELLDGIDLERLVEKHGAVPPPRAVHFLSQACRSLEEAHAHGLVHRDIKPANLFCCRYGLDLDFVKVLDFGVVRLPAATGVATRLTGVSVIGTPAYLAPETVRGDSEPDARTDIYALGCVAYWLVTGKLVFPARTMLEAAYKHVESEPEPPSLVADGITPELDRIILDCLAKRPDQRPASAGELRKRFEACPLPAPWSQSDAAAWWSRHMPAVADDGPLRARSVPKIQS